MGKLMFQAIEFGRDSSWAVGKHYRLCFTADGNLQLWNVANKGVVWETNTKGEKLAMQADGNFVIYASEGRVLWASDTSGHRDACFAAQDDGNLVIYTADLSKTIWSTKTAGK
jgi:hypothetical protein